MKLFRRSKAYFTLEEREQSRSTRSEGIRYMLFVSGIVVLCFVAFLGLTVSLSPMLGNRAAVQERELRLRVLAETYEEEERTVKEKQALADDKQFNEAVARDKGFARPGEIIIHISADSKLPEPDDRIQD